MENTNNYEHKEAEKEEEIKGFSPSFIKEFKKNLATKKIEKLDKQDGKLKEELADLKDEREHTWKDYERAVDLYMEGYDEVAEDTVYYRMQYDTLGQKMIKKEDKDDKIERKIRDIEKKYPDLKDRKKEKKEDVCFELD